MKSERMAKQQRRQKTSSLSEIRVKRGCTFCRTTRNTDPFPKRSVLFGESFYMNDMVVINQKYLMDICSCKLDRAMASASSINASIIASSVGVDDSSVIFVSNDK